MTTMTRTMRLAIGTAAMLALMSQAAQARPSGYAGSYRPSAPSAPVVSLAPDRADHIGVAPNVTPTALAPDRVDKIGTGQARTPFVPPTTTTVVRSTGGAFDWLAAAIGAGSALALALIGSAAVVARGRRRVPLSA